MVSRARSPRADPVWVLGLLLVALLPAACGTAPSGVTGSHDSGLRGQVLIGPTCAVQPADNPCVRPYQAQLTVRSQASGSVVARLHTSRAGLFELALAPGRYSLLVDSGHVFPRSVQKRIVVPDHGYARVTVMLDSGIRGALGPPPGWVCANPVGCGVAGSPP